MPTFGKTSDGTVNSASSVPKLFVSTASPASSGVVVDGRARVWMSSAGTVATKFVIYADSAGSPAALLAESDIVSLSTTSESEITFPFSGANLISITNGTSYWIGVAWDEPGTPSVTFSRDNTASQRQEQVISAWPTIPTPFGTPSATNSGPIDAYVNYNLAATGTNQRFTMVGIG